MKKFGKKILSFVLVATMISTSSPVFALTRAEQNKVQVAGSYISNAMKTIMDNYVGDQVTAEQLFEGALHGMTGVLDEYSEYMTKDEMQKLVDSLSGQFYGIGISYYLNQEDRLEILKVINGSPAETAGVLKGDFIKKINGKDVEGVSSDQVALLISTGNKDEVQLDVERGREIKSFTIKKDEVKIKSVHLKKIEDVLPAVKGLDNQSIRYMQIDFIGDETSNELKEAIAHLKSQNVTDIILDLRGNGGGLMDATIDICNQIVPEGPIFYTVNKAGKKETYKSKLQTKPFENIIIMTDKGTASAAELITAALQDSGAAKVVGQTSYGKGVIQSVYSIENGGSIKLTTMEYLRRNGNKLNKIGITPDIEVKLPTFVYDPIALDKNNTSTDVPHVKEMLSYLGYQVGEMNTYYDDTTKASVMEFQKANDLTADGKLGYETVIQLDLVLYKYIAEQDPVLKKAYESIVN